MQRHQFPSLLIALLMTLVPALSQAVTLSGTVLDEESETPIEGALVELVNSNAGTGFYSTRTDSGGQFVFQDIRQNLVYDLGVVAEGYVIYEMRRWQAPGNQEEIDLRIPLIRGSRIHGTITQSDGETPLQNVQITLNRVRGDYQMLNPTQSIFSDENGHFSFDRLPPNQYELELSHAEYINERITALRMQPGDEKNLNLEMIRPATITGTVLLAGDASPLADMEIAARGASQGVATSDANGMFSITSLKPGSYQLSSHPAGFHVYETTQAIQVQEGELIENQVVQLKPMPPALNVSVTRDVFLPDERPEVSVRSFRLGQYHCEVLAVPFALFTENPANLRELTGSASLTGFERIQQWTQDVEFQNPYVWFDHRLQIPEPLDPGAYLLRLTSDTDNLDSRLLLYVTDLGIMVKRGDSQTMVFATDLTTSQPVEGVRIRMESPERDLNWDHWDNQIRDPSSVEWNAITSEDGVAMLNNDVSGYAAVLALAPNGSFAVSRAYSSSYAQQGKQRILVYTDRPLYRPGDTVYYKAIIRERDGQSFQVPSGETATVEIRNPRGDVIESVQATLSAWGSLDDSFEIPAATDLGSFSVRVNYNGGQGSISLDVEEYRTPEFRVEVNSAEPYYINGETVAFQARAEYYFGAPVANAIVNYRVYEAMRISAGPDGFPQSYNSFIQSGQTRTDAEGIARIEFVPRRSSVDRQVTVEVGVEEGSGRQVSSRASVPVGVGKFTIAASASQSVFSGQNPVTLDLETRTHDDKPVSTEVLVEFIQEVWNPVRKKYVRPSRPLASMTVTTDSHGKATAQWVADPGLSGNFIAILTATDDKQNLITTQTSFWRMSASTGNFNYRYPTLEGILDKAQYQPGETATLLVHTNYPENPILLTLESADILSHQLIWPSGKSTRIEIPIEEHYAPNIHIGLFLPRERRYSQRTLNLTVPVAQGDLRVSVQTDRPEYRPGDEATVTVQTQTPDHQPVAAEVSLAVVDEALFALRSDKTPDVYRVFYGEQPNWIVTTVSYPMRYFGGANKGVRPDIRKDFRDTATWLPRIHTDETGTATASFRFPDNLTSWRFTGIGHTMTTDIGSTRTERTVTKDIVARLSLPRFFTEDDSLSLPTQVTNRTDHPLQQIDLTLSAEGGATLTSETTRQTNAAAGAVARNTWNVHVRNATSPAGFEFTAISEHDSDGVYHTAPVLPLGMYQPETRSTWMQEEGILWQLNPPQGASPERTTLTLTITPGLAAITDEAIRSLQSFPYTCTEQIIHRYLPALVAQHTYSEIGLATEPMDDGLANELLNQLRSRQNSDGGWGWFASGESRVELTCLAGETLARLRFMGMNPNPTIFDRAADYLVRQIAETREWDTQALIVDTLSQLNKPSSEARNELLTNRNELSTRALTHLARTLHREGDVTGYRETVDLLMDRQLSYGDQQAAWDVLDEDGWSWSGNETETNALALSALIPSASEPAALAPVLNWLTEQRRGTDWGNTKTTGTVVMALCDWMRAFAPAMEEDTSLQVWQGETRVLSRTLSSSERRNAIRMELSPTDGQSIRVVSNHDSVAVALHAEWFLPGMLPPHKTSDVIEMERVITRALHARDYRGRPRILPEHIDPNETFAVGDELLIQLTLDAERDLPFAILEESLPSGFEVVESFLRSQETGYVPYQRSERRDDRMVFFLERIPEGELVIEYLIRAELPGTFHINPGEVWCMYHTDVRARTASDKLMVEEK